jgi:hypothetical protein
MNQHQQHKISRFDPFAKRESAGELGIPYQCFKGVGPADSSACQRKLWLAICLRNNPVASTFQRWRGGCVD